MTDTVTRRDFHVRSCDGYDIAIREVAPAAPPAKPKTPVLLMHGTRLPGISEYDLPVENGSLAADLARAGHLAFVPDARGYGNSKRPDAMSHDPSQSAPFARCIEIVRDIDAATDAMTPHSPNGKIAMMGWGVGATAVIMHAAMWPEKVSHLILYNPLYGGGSSHPRYKNFQLEDPARPGHFNRAKYGGYSFNQVDMLRDKWDATIPVEDKDSWRDPAIAQAFEDAIIDSDPTSRSRDPVTYRYPNGMIEDSYYIGKGEKLVHASQVYCKVLVVRPQLDYFSRPEDIAALRDDLVNAETVEVWEPANTTHYILLDRPERGRDAAISKILEFVNS